MKRSGMLPLLLWRRKDLVGLENADICLTGDIAVRYLDEVSIIGFRLKLVSDDDFAPVLTCLQIVSKESLSVYIIEPDEFISVELF
jgi:hypothetical protein